MEEDTQKNSPTQFAMISPPNSPLREEHNLPIKSPNLTQEDDNPDPLQNPKFDLPSHSETLEIHDNQIEESELPQSLNQPQQQEQEEGKQVVDQGGEDPDDDLQEQLGMSLSIQIPVPFPSPSNAPRRGSKRKKCNIKKQQAIEKKLQALSEKLNPIPFVPSKTLDFAKYETVLRRLGLWDLVQIEFDKSIRVDLLAQLVATYDSKTRGSYVNEFKIMVNRADLGRAFKLPVKKEKGNVAALETVDLDSEEFSEDSILFLEDFMNNWVLLHEDTWIMPSEVLNWTRAIKDGHPDKVDWAGVIWFMAEKELMQGQQLGDCYYASHLQYLIKSQREEVFREEPKMEEEVEVKDDEDVGDMKIDTLDVFRGQDNFLMEDHKLDLTLGQDIVEKEEVKEEDLMDVEQCKEEEEEENVQWVLDGKNNGGDSFLRRCTLGTGFSNGEGGKQEEEEDQEEEEEEEGEETENGFNLSLNGDDVLTGNLLQGMETTQVPFGLPGHFCDQPEMELIAPKTETTHMISAGPSTYSIGNKREMGHDHDIPHHTLNNGSNKRMRTDDMWDHKTSDFEMCMENMQQWMGKARMLHEAKGHALEQSTMNQQILLNEVQKRDNMIDHLHKVKFEEMKKKDGEIYRLERELDLMGTLLEGYRNALKEKQKEFSEYRQHFPHPEEPLYKDAGSGGVVLSIMELEKQRQKREEECRLNLLMAEKKAKELEEVCIRLLEGHHNKVVLLDERLMDLGSKVKLLQELSASRKASRIQDVVLQKNDEVIATSPSEKQVPSEMQEQESCDKEEVVAMEEN